jgi:hypothetical protein
LVYENRLELTRLLLADFDPAVTAIAAQPFLLRAHAGGRVRRHVPNFFLVRADESALLVNVKPAARLADPAVAGALEWPGRLAREQQRQSRNGARCQAELGPRPRPSGRSGP